MIFVINHLTLPPSLLPPPLVLKVWTQQLVVHPAFLTPMHMGTCLRVKMFVLPEELKDVREGNRLGRGVSTSGPEGRSTGCISSSCSNHYLIEIACSFQGPASDFSPYLPSPHPTRPTRPKPSFTNIKISH